jgi:hypothetical protein
MCSFTKCQNVEYRLNQEAAIESIKSIRAAQQKFREIHVGGRYGSLKELADAGLIDQSLSDGRDRGYRFEIRLKDDSYSAVAVPEVFGESAYKGTGGISLYVDETGVIRWDTGKGHEATLNDPPLAKQD